MKRILIAAFLFAFSSNAFSAACTNPIGVKDGAGTSMNFNTTVDGSSNCTSNVIPGTVLTTLSGWTSATALNTTQTIMSANGGAPAILLQLDQTSTLTVGATTIEGTYDGTNWVSVPVAQLLNPNTFAPLTNPYTLVASTNQPFLILTQGYQGVRVKLSTAITGSATVTPFVALLSTNPVIGALLNPLAAGSAIIGKVGVDQTTPGTTNGVAIVGVNAATALAGNGVTGTGSQRVTVASDNTPFATKVDQTTPGTTNGVALVGVNAATALAGNGVTGTGSARVTVASDNTPFPIKIDQTTVGSTNAVSTFNSKGMYETIAASQTGQTMGPTGGTGDYLSHCTVYPTSTSPGVVTVFDNTSSATNNVIAFAGGASSTTNLVPFTFPVGAFSVNGPWKVTTGANLVATCYGKFT